MRRAGEHKFRRSHQCAAGAVRPSLCFTWFRQKPPSWPAGIFFAEWYDLASGTNVGYSQASTTNGVLTLPLPDYSADLVGIVYPPPVLTAAGVDSAGCFQFRFDSETGGRYLIEQSADLAIWAAFLTVTNS